MAHRLCCVFGSVYPGRSGNNGICCSGLVQNNRRLIGSNEFFRAEFENEMAT